MNESPLVLLRRATELFLEQTQSDFGRRLVADCLEPMSRELEVLTEDIEQTINEIADLQSQLTE